MNKEKVNQGYAVEGKLKKSTKGYLVLYSIKAGRISYTHLVQVARRNNLKQDQIPHLRSAKNAFAKAKDSLQGVSLPNLLELEGWDGMVKQTVKVTPLKRANEYQVSIMREGRMNGKLHKASLPVFRLEFDPPKNVDHRAWIRDYMRAFWDEKYQKLVRDGKVILPEISEITRCINIVAYWEGETVDQQLMDNLRRRIVAAFQTSVIGVDGEMLRQNVETVILNQLSGVKFLAGRGAVYVPLQVEEKDTSETLDAISNLITAFASGATTEIEHDNYYDQDNEAIDRYGRTTEFRYLGYLDGDRELEYIRKDIGDTLSKEISEYWASLVEMADTFNEEKVKEFEKKIDTFKVKKQRIDKRIKLIGASVGGDIPIRRNMYSDLKIKMDSRVAAIPLKKNAVRTSLTKLIDFK
jgi:hypothetical protein